MPFRISRCLGSRDTKGRSWRGHAGHVSVAILEGRVHYYEGYSMGDVVFGARVLGSLGVESIILTNAAGAVNTSWRPGELMLVSDHINLMGTNPLLGLDDDRWGPRFLDQTAVYSPELRSRLRRAAMTSSVTLREGIYAAMPGPAYETPAEIRCLRTAGVDAVGMSTVPEAMAARQMGVKVAALSVLTNMAAGIISHTLSHQEVLKTARHSHDDLIRLLQSFFESYA